MFDINILYYKIFEMFYKLCMDMYNVEFATHIYQRESNLKPAESRLMTVRSQESSCLMRWNKEARLCWYPVVCRQVAPRRLISMRTCPTRRIRHVDGNHHKLKCNRHLDTIETVRSKLIKQSINLMSILQ